MWSALLRQQQQHQHSAVHALKPSSPSSSEAVRCLLLQSQLHPQQHDQHAVLPPGLQDVNVSGNGTSSESCASHTHSPSVQHSTTQDLTSNPSSSRARTVPNSSSGAPGAAGQASRQNPRGGGSSSSLCVPPDAAAMLHGVQRPLSKGGRNHSSSSGLRRLSTGSGYDSQPTSALKGLLLQTLACRQQQQAEQQHHLAQDRQDMHQRLLSVLRATHSQHNMQDAQSLQQQQPECRMRSLPPPAALAAAAADSAGPPSAVSAAVQLLDVVGAQVSPTIASMRQRLLQERRALAQDAAAAGLPFDVEAETRHLLPQLKPAALLAARLQHAAAGSVSEASQQQNEPDQAGFGAAAAGAAQVLARTRTAGSADTSALAAYIEDTLLAAALPLAATAGSSHPRDQHVTAVAAAGPAGLSVGAPGWGSAEPPLSSQLSRLLGLHEPDDARSNSSNSWLQALELPNSSGRTSQPAGAPPLPPAAAAAVAAGRPLLPPAVPERCPSPPSGLGGQGQVPGLSLAVRADRDGCHDYIEELMQQELTAAMLEQLGGP